MKWHYRWKRFLVALRRLQARNQGDWFWLRSKPTPVASLNRDLWRWAEPSANYYTMLGLSGVIATLGLLANSSATIIGAMIIAPLMGPINAIAFAMAMGNRRLLKRATFTILSGILLSVLIASIITWLLGLSRLTAEIEIRMEPNLIDLGVALAAGAAGAFAKSRRHIADALPGVAIAVALVPPLSVIGIGLALPSRPVAVGAALLFLTNLASIVLSGALVFILQKYGSLRRAQQGITLSALILVCLGLPLGLSFRDLVIQEKTRSRLLELVARQTQQWGNIEINRLSVYRQHQGLIVKLELAASITPVTVTSVTAKEVDALHQAMETTLGKAITLEVAVVPVTRFQFQPSP
ncbi:MAG: DUF389 domain-containing protein [Cyanobacteria bacterium]|nr:DUF389 domain-containing protein [Cyanobacteriota bacterium]MDA0866047.1 DUF389 domain-containing protein [Cyanobacteriota bacterium]